jgi:hypothetical protein
MYWKLSRVKFQSFRGETWWYVSVIVATQEAEIWRIILQGKLPAKNSRTLPEK